MTEENFVQTASKAYVRFVLQELRLSPSALAKKAKIASTTLTRALNDPSHKFTLSMSTLGKIATASGISPQPFFEAGDFVEMSMVPFVAPNLYDDSWGAGANAGAEVHEKNDASSILVIGETGAGVWKAPELRAIEDGGILGLAIPGYRDKDTFSLKVGDDTGQPFVREGEYVVCIRRSAESWSLGHGDLVVVERWSEGKSLLELSLRRLIETPKGGAYLRFDNPSAAIRETIELDAEFSDRPDFKILGIVRYVVRGVSDPFLNEEVHRYGFHRRKNPQ